MARHSGYLLALAVILVFFACPAQSQTVWELLNSTPQLSNLVNATSVYPDLVTLLNNSEANTTVFAPNNDALTTTEVEESLLRYHFINGQTPSAGFKNGEVIPTLLLLESLKNQSQQIKVKIDNGTVFINTDAQVVTADLNATNGYVHEINKVLTLPPSVETLLNATSSVSLFVGLLGRTNISLDMPAVTAFAPTDAAFTTFSESNSVILTYLLLPQGQTDLEKILGYHVAIQVIYTKLITTTATTYLTLEGQDVNVIKLSDGTIAVDFANVTTSDILASNGVVQLINQVLVPDDFQVTLRKMFLGLGLTDFISLLDGAGSTLLDNPNVNLTIFAPTNAAITAFQGNLTADLLNYHVSTGGVAFDSLTAGQLLDSLYSPASLGQPQKLKITADLSGNKFVNFVSLNLTHTYGSGSSVIYVIDTVLSLPPALTLTAQDLRLRSFLTLLEDAQLTSFVDSQNVTVLAITDDAYAAVPAQIIQYLRSTNGSADLQNIINFHIITPQVYYTSNLPLDTPIQTHNGDSVTASTANGTITFNGGRGTANVHTADNLASNGVLHTITALLFPPSFDLSLRKLLIGFEADTLITTLATANLTFILEGTDAYTILAPTDTAFAEVHDLQALLDNHEQLREVLLTHVIVGSVPALVAGAEHRTLNNKTIVVSSDQAGTVVTVHGTSFSATVLNGGQGVAANNGVVYSVNRVFAASGHGDGGDGDGLSGTAVGFIVVGCIVGALLIAAAIGGGFWWYKNRRGYVQIGERF